MILRGRRRFWLVFSTLVFLSVCFLAFGFIVPIQMAFYLGFGWLWFIPRVVSQLELNPVALIQTGLLIAVLVLVTNRVFSWMLTDKPWPRRWTWSLLTMLVLMFTATIAATGIVHQLGWLLSSPEPLFSNSWSRPGYQAERMCRVANDKIAKLESAQVALAELRRQPAWVRAAEGFHLVPVISPEGRLLDIVRWPRQPMNTSADDPVACLGGRIPKAFLPRLLVAIHAGQMPDIADLID